MRPLILFSVGGVGLGNSTRCDAVIRELDGCQVEVMGFGNAVSYFRKRGRAVRRLIPLRLGGTAFGSLLAAPYNLAATLVNVLLSSAAIIAIRPDAVVVDSEYSAILPALLLGRRVVSINNAPAIVALWPRYRRPDLLPSFYGRELWDSWVNRLCDRVIVPSFDPGLSLGAGIDVVPPIVRTLPPQASRKSGLLVVRGGSPHVSPLTLPKDAAWEEIGAAAPADDALERMSRADVIVCQGGASTLSEAIALGARIVSVPLRGHAEQSINSRFLADQGAVTLAEDGDVGAALARPRVRPASSPGPYDGAPKAARILSQILETRASSAVDRRLEWGGVFVWLTALILELRLDHFFLSRGLVKMENGNVQQLEYHALIRDGIVLLASPIGYYADALHNWFFHLLLLMSPRPENAAVWLNALCYLSPLILFVGMRRRFGAASAAVAAGLMVAAPVSFILSKHMISTSLVPLAGVYYVLRYLDFAETGESRFLGESVAALAVLIALNHAHAWLVLPLAYEMFRKKNRRIPSWALAVAAAALSTGAAGFLWSAASGRGLSLPLFSAHYRGVSEFVRRAVFVEWRMNDVLPELDLLFLLVGWSVWVFARRFEQAPRGLLALLAYLLPMALINREASVFWQVPLCVMIGWSASRSRSLAGGALAYVFLTMSCYSWLVPRALGSEHLGSERPDFLVLSSVRTRYETLNVLTKEMGMQAEEFEHLTVSSREKDGPIPALLPGLSYIVDRVEPILPPGGDRCFSVSDSEEALPPGAALDRRVDRFGLIFKSWRGGPPCPGNVRPLLEPVLGLDLENFAVRVIRFDPARTVPVRR